MTGDDKFWTQPGSPFHDSPYGNGMQGYDAHPKIEEWVPGDSLEDGAEARATAEGKQTYLTPVRDLAKE